MDETTITINMFWVILFTGIVGLLVIGAVAIFAWRAFSAQSRSFIEYERFIEFWKEKNIRPNIPKYLNDAYSDHLQKRNEFWSTYGQIIAAIFIVIVLAILLLTKTISAEAGLPILSAVSGFAIAKGVNSTKNNPSNPFDNDNVQ